jgi:hypothetical protein
MENETKYISTDYAGKLASGFLRNPLTIVLGIFYLLLDIWHLKLCLVRKTHKW